RDGDVALCAHLQNMGTQGYVRQRLSIFEANTIELAYNSVEVSPMKYSERTSRRHILRIAAAAMGGGLLAQQKAAALENPGTLGAPLGPYGDRSPFEKAVRRIRPSR